MTHDFTTALNIFIAGCQKIMDDHKAKNFPNITRDILAADIGKKYARITRKGEGEEHGSVHCFVGMATGDVLKAASWKVPAKHARGNIYAPDCGLKAMTPYGAAYLR